MKNTSIQKEFLTVDERIARHVNRSARMLSYMDTLKVLIYVPMLALMVGQVWGEVAEEECVRIALQKYEQYPNLGAYDPARQKLVVKRVSRAEAARRMPSKGGQRACDESALPPGEEFIHIRLISLELIRAWERGERVLGGGSFNAIIDPQTGVLLSSYREM